MTVSLTKGGNISLTKQSADSGNTLHKLTIGLGWKEKPSQTSGKPYDLDASAFGLDSNGQIVTEDWFVFWGSRLREMTAPATATEEAKFKMFSPNREITHMGDNLTGAGDGDDEVIVLDLDIMPAEVAKIVFAVTIYEGKERGQNFGQVDDSYIRALDDNGTELAKYELDMEAALETVVTFAELSKRNGEWFLSAKSAAFPGGFDGLCRQYGVPVAP
ncbi:MAG TPA: TerD family protein [Candidatus Microsaccharimonas sp.]|jgi:tellurium resistance protein TerD